MSPKKASKKIPELSTSSDKKKEKHEEEITVELIKEPSEAAEIKARFEKLGPIIEEEEKELDLDLSSQPDEEGKQVENEDPPYPLVSSDPELEEYRIISSVIELILDGLWVRMEKAPLTPAERTRLQRACAPVERKYFPEDMSKYGPEIECFASVFGVVTQRISLSELFFRPKPLKLRSTGDEKSEKTTD